MFGDFADPVFQHTAARRRLEAYSAKLAEVSAVSTHSRPKAAGKAELDGVPGKMFQHTAARRRLSSILNGCASLDKFQHTAARRRLV